MQQGITPAEILTADSAPKSAQKDKTYVAIREYPIYTYLHVRSLAFAFEVLKAIGMRRKRVVSAAAAAGSGLSRAPTAQDFYFSKQPSFLASCSSQTGSTHPKTIRGDERRQKENNQISGVGPIGLPRFGELGTTNTCRFIPTFSGRLDDAMKKDCKIVRDGCFSDAPYRRFIPYAGQTRLFYLTVACGWSSWSCCALS